MVYIIDVALCDGDGACINACPRRAISLKNR
jgi:NAD-dependent dihydropyrimidine dehydrogenase PreA subunit